MRITIDNQVAKEIKENSPTFRSYNRRLRFIFGLVLEAPTEAEPKKSNRFTRAFTKIREIIK